MSNFFLYKRKIVRSGHLMNTVRDIFKYKNQSFYEQCSLVNEEGK